MSYIGKTRKREKKPVPQPAERPIIVPNWPTTQPEEKPLEVPNWPTPVTVPNAPQQS